VQITKDMTIKQAVSKFPKTVDVFRRHGMGCFGWASARYENIEQGALAHGVDPEILIRELNEAAKG